MRKKRILILCTQNSARSQMAEGILRHYGGDCFEVLSAGTNPSRVHPLAIQVMKEIGIDISGQRSKSIDEFKGQEFDVVITVCDTAKEACPIFPGSKKQLHWSFPDPPHDTVPSAASLTEFRRLRDRLHARFKQAAAESEL